MPSSKNYVRDYKQEAKTSRARGEIGGHDSPNAERKRARRKAIKMGMIEPHDKRDIDHKTPLVKGGSNSTSNLRPRSQHANRSFARTKNAGMK